MTVSYSLEGESDAGALQEQSPPSTSASVSSALTSPLQPPPVKKKKATRGDDVDEAIIKSLKDLEERRTRREVGENESFGRHIGAVLRRFSPRQQAQARLRIEQVLIDVEFPDDAHTPMHYSDNSYSNASFRY